MKHTPKSHSRSLFTRGRTILRGAVALTAVATLAVVAGCAGGGGGGDDNGKVTIQFAQWWEPELPEGLLAGLIDQFEEQNPDISVELLSNPYANTQQQIFANATAGQFPDVVGLDGSWVNELYKQGALADLGALMEENDFDTAQLSAEVKVDGTTVSTPVVNFPYFLYSNDDLLAEAGVNAPPTTRSEFLAAAKQVADSTEASGTALPLALTDPSGIQIAVLNWLWATQGTMLTDDQAPDLTNEEVSATFDFIKQQYDDGSVAPGAFTMLQQDMVQGFTNGTVAMMVDSPAHLNGIRADNPDLNLTLSQIPFADGYSGQPGAPSNAWGIGVSAKTEHSDAAFKLVSFLLSPEANGQLASGANAFPGNVDASPDFEGKDEMYKVSFEIYKEALPIENQFSGLPNAQDLMRTLLEELQATLDGQKTVKESLETAQTEWSEAF